MIDLDCQPGSPTRRRRRRQPRRFRTKKIEPTAEPLPNTKKTDAALNKMDDRKVDVTAQLQGVSSYNSQLAAMTKDRTAVNIRPVVTPIRASQGRPTVVLVQANKMYMIGERGPELFVAVSEAGFIHPAESPFTKCLQRRWGALQFVDPMQKTNLVRYS